MFLNIFSFSIYVCKNPLTTEQLGRATSSYAADRMLGKTNEKQKQHKQQQQQQKQRKEKLI